MCACTYIQHYITTINFVCEVIIRDKDQLLFLLINTIPLKMFPTDCLANSQIFYQVLEMLPF